MYATFKRKKIIFYAISVFSAICLIAVAIAFRASRSGEKPSELNAGCVSFLRDKKVKLSDKKPQSIETALLAHEFSETVKEYNELQKRQGFDLTEFAGKTVTKYTYRVACKDRTDVVAVVFVYGGKIIGGDIHCIGADGYMTGFDGETV